MSQYIPPRISELTPDDLAKMARGVGLPGLPYPMAKLETQGDKTEWVLGAIESATEPLIVYSRHRSIEDVNRELYCNMPTPSMMTMARDLIETTKPQTKNRLMTIFGDPSSGKTFLFRQVGALVHPEGVIMVDCGGMNVRELFWRTIIDYGTGVREQLDVRAANGTLNPQSIAALKAEFPNAIVEKDGRVAINWSAIGEKRDDKETAEAAMERAQKLLAHIYGVYEGINVQSNAFGIKSVPGELLKSFQSGRPILLDEFTKCKIGSDDSMQTFLEFVRGDRAEWTTINPMPTTAADDEKVVTLRAEDIRFGWHVGVSGNEAKDGDTTHNISDSMKSRLNPRYITDMTTRDWEHRISQLLAGFPAKTFHDLFSAAATANPLKFAELMNGLSTLNMSAAELKMRPAHHHYLLQNFPDLIEATTRLAHIYATRQALSNTESVLFKEKKWQNCSDEIMAGGAQKLQVTSRRFLDDLGASLRLRPQVVSQDNLTLEFDLHAVFNAFRPQATTMGMAGWHNMGAALTDVIVEGIVNDTAGMPLVRNALIAECKDNGIIPMGLKEAKPSDDFKSLADLLSYDPLKDKGLGNSEQAKMVAGALYRVLKEMHPDIEITPDQFPLENVAMAMQEIESGMKQSAYGIALLNTDLDSLIGKPVKLGYSVPIYALDGVETLAGPDAELVPISVLLSSLTIAGQQEENLKRLWPHDMAIESAAGQDDSFREIMGILSGASQNGFDLALLQVGGKDGGATDLHILRDRVRDKVMVMGGEDIDAGLKSALMKAGISYHLIDNNATFEQVDKFIHEGEVARDSQVREREEKTVHMMKALMTMYGIEEAHMGKEMTFGKALKDNRGEPQLYSRVVMPRKP